MEYSEYLKTKHWEEIKNKFKKDKCYICGRKNYLHLHHKNYQCLHNETEEDIVTLCAGCHLIVHNMEKQSDNLTIETTVEKLKETVLYYDIDEGQVVEFYCPKCGDVIACFGFPLSFDSMIGYNHKDLSVDYVIRHINRIYEIPMIPMDNHIYCTNYEDACGWKLNNKESWDGFSEIESAIFELFRS